MELTIDGGVDVCRITVDECSTLITILTVP